MTKRLPKVPTRDGWSTHVTVFKESEYFSVRAWNGKVVMNAERLTREQVESFDPDAWWANQLASKPRKA